MFTTTAEGTVYALDDVDAEAALELQYRLAQFRTADDLLGQRQAICRGSDRRKRHVRDMLNKTPAIKDMQNTSMLYVFAL